VNRDARTRTAVAHLTGELTGDYDAETLLQYICDQSVACLDVVLATLVVMTEGAELVQLAVSSGALKEKAYEGLSAGGPSAESAQYGNITLTEDVRLDQGRWPNTAEHMRRLDLVGARGFPMRLMGRPMGSLTLYTADAWGPTRGSLIGQTFADLAVLVLTQDEIVERRLNSVANVVTALVDQQAWIYQAQGLVAEEASVTIQEASELLTDAATGLKISVGQIARRLVHGSLAVSAVLGALE
jgi:hypothetical protein